MGTMLMDSVPPATATSPCPATIRSAAIAMACSPEEQKRLIVIAEDSTGKPARKAAIRATFIPCSASGIAQPRITSSISLGSRPFARATASLIATAARSSGRVARNVPFGALPTAVRTELTITASRIDHLTPIPGPKPIRLHWMPASGKKQQAQRIALKLGRASFGHSWRRAGSEAKFDFHKEFAFDGLPIELLGLIFPPVKRVERGLLQHGGSGDYSHMHDVAAFVDLRVNHHVSFDVRHLRDGRIDRHN